MPDVMNIVPGQITRASIFFGSASISFAQASIFLTPASIFFSQAESSFTSRAIWIDADPVAFVVASFPFDARVQDMASDVIEEVDASKGESDALISMGSAFTQEDACVKDEPARLSWKRAEVKGIERTIIGMGAAGKQIDAAISAIDDDTKGVPSTSIEDRSASKEMRHDRTGETAETLAFLSVPTCFTARGKELGAGLPAFQAAPIGMADEAKTFTALSPDDVGTVCG